MSDKNIDSSPISLLEDIFNVKQSSKRYKNNDISLLTEIHDQKVIMAVSYTHLTLPTKRIV